MIAALRYIGEVALFLGVWALLYVFIRVAGALIGAGA